MIPCAVEHIHGLLQADLIHTVHVGRGEFEHGLLECREHRREAYHEREEEHA